MFFKNGKFRWARSQTLVSADGCWIIRFQSFHYLIESEFNVVHQTEKEYKKKIRKLKTLDIVKNEERIGLVHKKNCMRLYLKCL